jgi:thioredoxin 1
MMSDKFQNIINSNKPVLVDFYADWCAPCKQVAPILKEVKDKLKENVRIIKVNVDVYPVIATKYQIRSLPTLMVFKNGDVKWSGLGVRTVNEIKDVLLSQIHEK